MRHLGFAAAFVCLCLCLGPTPAHAKAPTAYDVCKAFRAASLDAEPCTRMTKADFGAFLSPPRGLDARRFLIDSLCARIDEDPCDSGGRVLIFKRMSQLRHFKAYYDGFGDEGDLFFSWTFVNKRHKLLVQINGELPRKAALRYRAVVAGL